MHLRELEILNMYRLTSLQVLKTPQGGTVGQVKCGWNQADDIMIKLGTLSPVLHLIFILFFIDVLCFKSWDLSHFCLGQVLHMT